MLLAIDTSTAQVGLALHDGERVLAEETWTSRQNHTIELAPALEEMFRRSGVGIADLKVIGVALGPGSFTSLRVGLALAKGLALARHLPLIGIPTLDIIATAQPASKLPLAAVVQAGRGRLGIGWYKNTKKGWTATEPPRLGSAEELAKGIDHPTLIAGELSSEERQRLTRKYVNVSLASAAYCVRRPGILAELAWNRYQVGNPDAIASLAPIYLHLDDVPPV
jgi:tRNA threonylcarbamoyladenosine biosynthesis protein TsaB